MIDLGAPILTHGPGDIWVYKHAPAPDCNSDGLPDACDPDCNENGIPDGCEVFDGTSLDGNEDGVPDQCQLEEKDCDGNGFPDDCDPDLDADGLPDSCDNCPEDFNPGQLDCDEDGSGDSCDPSPCLPTGACCFSATSECLDLIAEECTIQAGDYKGDGTECLGDGDGNGIDDACEEPIPSVSVWGLTVMTVLVLAAGMILIARRRQPAAA